MALWLKSTLREGADFPSKGLINKLELVCVYVCIYIDIDMYVYIYIYIFSFIYIYESVNKKPDFWAVKTHKTTLFKSKARKFGFTGKANCCTTVCSR